MGLISRGSGQKPPQPPAPRKAGFLSFSGEPVHIFSFLQWAPCFDRRALSTLTTSLNHGIQRIFKNLTATFSCHVPQAARGKGCHLKISFLFLPLSSGDDEGRKHLFREVPTEECSPLSTVKHPQWHRSTERGRLFLLDLFVLNGWMGG